MVDYKKVFSGKKITVMGLGLLGRAVGDVKFLVKQGAELIVTDLKTVDELKPSLAKLKGFSHITYHLGGHRLEDFTNCDFILKAAGVPLDSPFIAEARKYNIPIEMSTSLAVSLLLPQVTVIGVTGTRGKSTTTQLIFDILKTAKYRVHLGGNVAGVSTLALLPKIKSGDYLVLELDSWQLQGFGERNISPQIAVFTNFMSDHLNYYKGKLEQYRADKENIFKFQKPGDTAIRGWELTMTVPKNWNIKLLGEHNLNNIACALAVARAVGIADAVSRRAVEKFKGVPGRLELIRTVRGIKFYNDTTATTPEATLAALRALGSTKKVILIAGGADKNLDVAELVQQLPKYCKSLILLPGSGTDKLDNRLEGLGIRVKNLKEAINKATNGAKLGDVVLLSPAFASFGPPPGGFKNEYDRGEQFNRLVKKSK